MDFYHFAMGDKVYGYLHQEGDGNDGCCRFDVYDDIRCEANVSC